jgi:hypothetical protein
MGLPHAQVFPALKVVPVTELVHYGLDGEKAPPMEYTGVHLQPRDYHEKLEEDNTVALMCGITMKLPLDTLHHRGIKHLVALTTIHIGTDIHIALSLDERLLVEVRAR